jgi:hypothetical protein
MANDTFDGEAISKADREFLESLGDHPLARHPLYGAPCPPPVDFGVVNPRTETSQQRAAREAFLTGIMDWMLVNYAFYQDAFIGKGGVISLTTGKITSIAALRGLMQPYALMTEGPLGGIKTSSIVDNWMRHQYRAHIDGTQTRSDRPRPVFEEDGHPIFNRYRPPVHPTSGGEIRTFLRFLVRLVPNRKERRWLWHYLAHKARRPWVPGIAVIMVAEEFGTGRGTLFDILGLLFGNDYVAPCSWGELTGTGSTARFNARLADALIAVVNEAVAEDGHQQAQRRLSYEAFKNSVDPSPTALRRFEAKGQDAYAQPSAMSTLIATNHRDVLKLPRDDRRCSVITCGSKMTSARTDEIRAWMAVPENIGAFYRALLATPAVPADMFDPFGAPPPFTGRLEMIDMARSGVEDAYEAAIEALGGYPLFTMTQGQRLIGYFGGASGSEGGERAKYTIAKNAYRVCDGRTRHRKRREVVYASTRAEQRRWQGADKRLIIAQLDRTEARLARFVNTGAEDIRAQIKALAGVPPAPESDDKD